MTSSQVTNSFGMDVSNWMSLSEPAVKTDGADFQSFMDSSAKNLKDADTSVGKTDTAKTDRPEKTVKDTVRDDKTAGTQKTEKDTPVSEERKPEDNEIDTVKEVVNEIKEAIGEQLDVTDEEISEALANLGLNAIALLNPENTANIVCELEGTEGTVSLVTDENLFNTVEELTDTIEELTSELTDELNIDPEEFKAAVEKLETQQSIPESFTEEMPVKEAPVLNTKAESVQTKDEPFENRIEFVNRAPEEAELKNFSVQTKENPESRQEFSPEERHEEETGDAMKAKDTPVSFAENLLNRTTESLNAVSESTVSYTSEQTEAILNQITESIRVQVSSENTEISLKLHPESLGNVNVSIRATNEGGLTAVFTAQNESVKEIIESQTVVLREALESKGITVEAVEVMVASHEFNEDLSERQEREEKSGSRKASVRRINLNAPEEEEELTEADALQKEIMAQNGNTVDYTA